MSRALAGRHCAAGPDCASGLGWHRSGAAQRRERGGIVWADATFREAQQNGSETRPNIFIVFESAGEVWPMKMDDCARTAPG